MLHHDSADLIRIFNRLFETPERTRLEGGGEEPVYCPAHTGEGWHRVIFTRDYFASALHEVSHWCIAGASRRRLTDYGYWYQPDGRSAARQREFERVEAAPQALEWLFCEAAGARFHLSFDNLEKGAAEPERFAGAVLRAAHRYLDHGLPPRALLFHGALERFYGRSGTLDPSRFVMTRLGGAPD